MNKTRAIFACKGDLRLNFGMTGFAWELSGFSSKFYIFEPDGEGIIYFGIPEKQLYFPNE